MEPVLGRYDLSRLYQYLNLPPQLSAPRLYLTDSEQKGLASKKDSQLKIGLVPRSRFQEKIYPFFPLIFEYLQVAGCQVFNFDLSQSVLGSENIVGFSLREVMVWLSAIEGSFFPPGSIPPTGSTPVSASGGVILSVTVPSNWDSAVIGPILEEPVDKPRAIFSLS